MLIELNELLALEKSGCYQEALDKIQTRKLDLHELSPARSLNLQLLEQRLRVRLKGKAGEKIHPKVHVPKIFNSPTWSAIITMWKRQDYLEEQLAAIRNQSIPPQEIIIILNERHIPKFKINEIGGSDLKIIHSDINSLYSRWAIAYIAKGDYVSVFDDDVIPGKNWIANAIRACTTYNALVGPAGRIYNKNGLYGYCKLVVSDASNKNTISCAETDIYCDWVCNSYLFKREWVGHALSSVRYKESFKTFDDIQLATSLYVSGGIRCVTPMQPSFDKSLHGSLKNHYGCDAHAIWKTNSDRHFAERKAYIEALIGDGFVPVQQQDNLYRFHLIVPFGERATLERCLLSVKGQDYKNFTCTLVDDCCDGADALELLRRLGLDGLNFRYIKTIKKAYPLRAREIATDMLGANPADVIVHLDGDDWFPYPDVLSRLNRIYRRGGVLVTYGNSLCIRNFQTRDFREYSQYDMSSKWNVGQKEPDAKVFPFRKLEREEVSNSWGDAPWCGMHLRSFQFAKWLSLNRKSFHSNKQEYLRVATDAAILVPILNSCRYDSIVFVPELAYIYQNAGNTIHSKNEISVQQKIEALAAIASADGTINYLSVSQALINGAFFAAPDEEAVILSSLKAEFVNGNGDDGSNLLNGQPVRCQSVKSSIVTIVTPNYLADAIICLTSYQRNLRCNCQTYVFVATDNPDDVAECTKILADSKLIALFPDTLHYTGEQSRALAQKYRLDTDEYRWAMKAVVLLELLNEGCSLALFLDPDTYTVSDITDVHQKLTLHPISVFPHFRDPDQEYLRGVLYKDGFFNGGMLAATQCGKRHLTRLYERCLNELVKDPSRQRWDDQKYFDLFALEVEHLYVNMDPGINYNYWNYEPVEGLIAPSQRSILLKSGFFARHWHVSTTLIRNSIELKDKKFSVYRPFVSIYLLSILYSIILLLAHVKSKSVVFRRDSLGLESRFSSIEEMIKQLSSAIPVSDIRKLLDFVNNCDRSELDSFLEKWVESLLKSICFDNLDFFARILGCLFPDNVTASKLQRQLRRHDLRYITDELVGSPDSNPDEGEKLFEVDSAGYLIKKNLQALQSCNICY